MRTLILAAATILTLTAVTAFTASGVVVGSGAPTDPIQKHQIRSGGLGGIAQGGFLRGGADDTPARGDMSGTGGGDMMGNMRGDMMGNMGRGR